MNAQMSNRKLKNSNIGGEEPVAGGWYNNQTINVKLWTRNSIRLNVIAALKVLVRELPADQGRSIGARYAFASEKVVQQQGWI